MKKATSRFGMNLKTMMLCTALAFLMLIPVASNAQLTGTLNVPNDYPTVAAAITALNTQGVGPGGAIIEVTAGYSETAPTGGYILGSTTLNASLSSSNPLIIQKTGAGINPLLSAYTGGTGTPSTAVQDGIFRLTGTDYVTIDGIDLLDPNTANPATMEYGYGLYKVSATEGCQNNTIKNCTITLNRINNASSTAPAVEGSVGINILNATAAANTTVLTVTSASGSNSFNKFYGNTIQNCNIGIALIGFAATTPFANADTGNDIGGSSSATGNTIINYGGGGTTSPAAAIRTLAQYDINVSYNTINNNTGSGVNHGTTLRGIYINTATSASASITNNIITLSSGATSSSMLAIENNSGSTAASNTITINNNTIQNCTYSTATSGSFTGISNGGSAAVVNIANNIVTNNTLPGTGTMTCIDGGSSSGNTMTINNNTVTNNTKTGASGSLFCIRSSTALVTVSGNTINNNGFTGTSGTSSASLYGYYNAGSPTSETYTNNTISNLSIAGSSTSTSSIIYGIHSNTTSSSIKTIQENLIHGLSFANSSTGTATVTGINQLLGTSININRNKIYNLSSSGSGSTASGVTIASGSNSTLANNIIGDLHAPTVDNTADAVKGINLTLTTANSTVNVYYNTVYLNASSSGTNFSSAGLFHTANATATTAALDLRNNIIINNSTAAGTGTTSAFRRSSTALNNYATTSNNNIFYAGAPSATNVIYFDGTTGYQTLSTYQAAASPRELGSRTENVPFLSLSGSSPDFLHVNTTIPTFAESSGSNIAGFTIDYDNNIRQGNAGYAGTGTAPDIGADEFEGVMIPVCSGTPSPGTITGLSALCSNSGTTLSLTGATSDPGITYQWGFSTTPGGPYTNMGTNPTQATGNLTVNTYYIVTVTCTYSGLSAVATEHLITVNPLPTVSVTPATTLLCNPGATAVALTASGANTYTWSPAAGLSATTGTSVSALPSSTTVYTVTGSDANGCINTASATITVGNNPSISAVTATPPSICTGSNSQLLATVNTEPVNTYLFAASTGATLDPMAGATTVITSGVDDTPTASPAPIGFTFDFNGVSYTQFSVSPDGWILLGSATANNQFTNSVTSTTNIPKIYPFWDDLATGTDGNVQTVVTGTAPNRILKVQWFVTIPRNTTGAANSTFQAWLYESTNVIEFRYGTMGTPTSTTISGGLTGGATNFHSITFASNTSSTTTANNANATTAPATGTMYTYTPPANTFLWSPTTFISGQETLANPVATAVTATTTYSVQVTSSVGCISSSSVTVAAGVPLTSTSNITPNNTVCAGTNVTLNSVPAGGGQPYTYSWAGPNGFTSTSQNILINNVTASDAGTYTVTVTDACSATSVTQVILTVNALPTVSVTPSTAQVCLPGFATLTASGADTYTWTPGAGLSATTGSTVTAAPFINTTYTVTGTDVNGCTNTATASITSYVTPVLTTTSATPSTVCSGTPVTLNATSSSVAPVSIGTGSATNSSAAPMPFNGTYGGSKGQYLIRASELTAAGLLAGNIYSLAIEITSPGSTYNGFTIGMSHTTLTDFVTPVNIQGGMTTVYPAANFTPVTGVNTFNFATPFNWDGTSNVIVSISWSNNNTSNSSSTVKRDATSYYASQTYRQDNETASNLAAFTGTTGVGTFSFTRALFRPMMIFNGSVNSTSTNTWAWNPGNLAGNSVSVTPSNNTGSSLVETYTVTTTDPVSGCSATATASVTVNPNPVATISSTTNVSCNSGNTGAATVTATSGDGNYTYSWSTTPAQTTATASNLTAGSYTVTVTDGNLCTATASVAITEPVALTATMMSSNASCNGGNNGDAMVMPTGGTGAYTYLWSDGQTTQTASNLVAGSYSVTVTDANLCTTTASVTITEPPVLAATMMSNNVSCNGGNNGDAMVMPTGGTGAYSYLWSDGQTTQTASNLVAGNYSVTVTDANFCTTTASVTITEPAAALSATTSSTDETCVPGTDGTATVSVIGGTAGYTYLWSDGQTTAAATGLAAGVYTVVITDANLCTLTETVTVNGSVAPAVTASNDTTICESSTISLIATGGVTYSWDNSAGTNDTVMVAPSNTTVYTVTVTDNNGCTATEQVTVTVDTIPVAAFTTSTTGLDVTFTNTSTNATTYTWDFGDGSPVDNSVNPVHSYPFDNTYYVTLIASNGCSSDTITDTLMIITTGIENANGIELNVTPNPSEGIFTLSLNNAGLSEIIVNVMDMRGRVVYSAVESNVNASYKKNIDVTGLSKGVYNLNVRTGSTIVTKRIVIQ